MAITQSRPRRKVSGGRYIKYRKKRIFELGSLPTLTRIGERKLKRLRVKGGNSKFRLLSCSDINLYDPKTKKYSKAVIKTVVENPANRNYVRRNILTKGTIVDTDKGRARILNRPGQESIVNAMLI